MKSTIFLSLVLLTSILSPIALAEHDEYEEYDDDYYENDDYEEYDEHDEIFEEFEDEDEQRSLGGGLSDYVLYITIIAIIVTVGYTLFKITRKRK